MKLLTRHHKTPDCESTAIYSGCETYRYALTRTWNNSQPRCLFIMLNPSTATELANDPTIERCERRARGLGYGGMRIANIFAFRATDPRDLKKADDPVGAANAEVLEEGLHWADHVLCAWGVHGEHLAQGRRVAESLSRVKDKLRVLGTTKAGHPRHPLYVAYAQPLLVWSETELRAYCHAEA